MAKRANSKGPTTPIVAETVLQEAARLFAERGYAQTRMKDIAERFGVTHAALYYHFRNKEEILIKINDVAVSGLLSQVRGLDAPPIPPLERFARMVFGHFEYVAENATLVTTLFDFEQALPTGYRTRLRVRRREYTSLIVRAFTEAQQRGDLSPDLDPGLTVNFVIGAGSWVYRWYKPEGPLSPQDLALHALRMLAPGLKMPSQELADLVKDVPEAAVSTPAEALATYPTHEE